MKRLSKLKVTLPRFTFKETPMNAYLVYTLVIFSFLLGMLTNKVMYLEKMANTPAPTATVADQAAPPPVTVDEETIKNLFTDNNLVFGDPNSKNLIVEVADPSCPYCHAAAGKNPELNKEIGPQFLLESEGGTYIPPVPKIKELVEKGDAAFVWLYSPGHGNGEMGTKAMYCADEQGKFWEVHDKLMTNEGYDVLNEQILNDTTKSQELADFLADAADPNILKACLDSGKYDEKLTQDSSTATSLGISGTPGFFVNTRAFPGAYSWTELEAGLN